MQDLNYSSLFILSCDYARISQALDELNRVIQQEDGLLLLEDAIHALNIEQINHFQNILILDQDSQLIPEPLPVKVRTISYIEFAQLIEKANSVHTWK